MTNEGTASTDELFDEVEDSLMYMQGHVPPEKYGHVALGLLRARMAQMEQELTTTDAVLEQRWIQWNDDNEHNLERIEELKAKLTQMEQERDEALAEIEAFRAAVDKKTASWPAKLDAVAARLAQMEAVVEAARRVRSTDHPENPGRIGAMNGLRQALISLDQEETR